MGPDIDRPTQGGGGDSGIHNSKWCMYGLTFVSESHVNSELGISSLTLTQVGSHQHHHTQAMVYAPPNSCWVANAAATPRSSAFHEVSDVPSCSSR